MVPFSITIECQGSPMSLLAEQLDHLADEEGFIRFDLRSKQQRVVIFVKIEEQTQALAMSQDLESSFEALYYPARPYAFSFDETFAKEEVERIGKAIRAYFCSAHLSSAAQTLLL
jgi:hypothetical protein